MALHVNNPHNGKSFMMYICVLVYGFFFYYKYDFIHFPQNILQTLNRRFRPLMASVTVES